MNNIKLSLFFLTRNLKNLPMSMVWTNNIKLKVDKNIFKFPITSIPLKKTSKWVYLISSYAKDYFKDFSEAKRNVIPRHTVKKQNVYYIKSLQKTNKKLIILYKFILFKCQRN